MVSVLASSAVYCGCSNPDLVKSKTMQFACVASPLGTQQYGERAKTAWLAWNQDNVSELGDMSILGLLFR